MLVQERMLDVTANNLANVNSAGFRGRTPVNKAFPTLLMEKIDGQPGETFPPKPEWLRMRAPLQDAVFANVLSETTMSTQLGVVRVTDNPLDVALEDKGFFVVSDAAGNTFYTRSGQFVRDSEGRLATHEGQLVQGQGGTVTLGEAVSAFIDEGGQVVVDGEVVDQLQVVNFADPTYLRHVGVRCCRKLLVPEPPRTTPIRGLPEERSKCQTSTWCPRWSVWSRQTEPTKPRPKRCPCTTNRLLASPRPMVGSRGEKTGGYAP